MLSSSIAQLVLNIRSISNHLSYLSDSKDFVVALNPNVLSSITDKEKLKSLKRLISKEREFNYNSNIISLYGYFEQYIESIIEEYVSKLVVIVEQFDKNGITIKQQFYNKWEKLYNKLAYPKYAHLTEEKLIQSLYDTKIANKNHLIPEYYFQNGGNYKHSVLCDCFVSLGIENISQNIKFYEPLHSYFINKGIYDQNENILYEILNDLVARRNDVAHGNYNSILDISYFKDYIDFIEMYAKSLNALLIDNLYMLKWEGKNSPIIEINHLYHNTIVEVEVEDFVVEVGDKILVKEPDGNFPKFSIREITSIRKNDVEKNEFLTYARDTVALGLSMNIKKRSKFKILN